MSKLLKSKFLLGVMIVAALFAVVGVSAPTPAAAATCTITSTLRLGSKGSQVMCLQSAVGVTADGSFGPKTKAAVVAWQKSVGLTADGVFGPKSNAVLMSASGMGMMGYPAGCTSSAGFSATTGASCATGMTTPPTGMTLPAGCTSSAGFSPTTGASCATGAVTGQTGPVSVSLASDNPASGYIVGGQATADLAHFTFTGTGTINSVVLQRTGISDQNTLSNVYLYQGNTRLTDGFSFNNTGQLTMNGLSIAVNGSTTISVKADVASNASASSLGISLIGFTAAGQAPVTVNVMGNQMTYGVGSLATVYVGGGTNQNTVSAASVNAGTSQYTVWSAPVQVNTRAVWLKGVNFRMVGSAPAGSLGNVNLFLDGVQVGSSAVMGTIQGTNYAMFDFSAMPVTMSTGSHTLELRADIVSGSSYTVTVSLQQAADLVIFDGQVGVNIAATTNSGHTLFSANTAGMITINAGSSSVVVDPAFQAMTNITGGATNTVIGRFKVHGYGEAVKVTSLNVTPLVANGVAGSCHTDGAGVPTNTCGLSNVTLYFNGSQVGSSTNWTSNSGAIAFNLGSQMILPAGTDSYIEVHADLQTTGSVNYTAGTVSATLNIGSGNAQGQSSQSTLSFPGSNVPGTSLTIQTGLLSVSKSSLANSTSNPNTAGVTLGEFTLQNQSSSEAIRVTSLVVALTQNGTTPLDNSTTNPFLNDISNLRTSETSGSGSTPIQPSASNTFSVNFTIAPGATKTIDVLGDLSSTVASSPTVVAKLTVTSLGASSNVSISQNGTGTAVAGQTVTIAAGAINTTPTLVSSSSTSGQFVPAANGATGATHAVFNVASANGSATISEAKFVVRGDATHSAAGTVSSIAVGGVTAPVVSAITNATTTSTTATGTSIVVAFATGIVDGSTVVDVTHAGTAVVSSVSGTTLTLATALTTVSGDVINVYNPVAYLTGLSLAVPNGGSGLNLTASVSYSPVGTNGIPSQSLANVSLAYLKYTAGNTTTTLCVASLSCGANLTAEIPGPTMELVGSLPTIAIAGSTDQLANSSLKLVEVTVTANAMGDIKLVSIPLKVSTTPATGGVNWDGSTTTSVIVKDTSGSAITATNTIPTVSGSCTGSTAALTGTCTTVVTLTGNYLIPAGTSKTFRFYVTAAGVSGAVNTMSLSTTLGASTSFSWLDVAGANATPITGTDNSTYFYNYPTDTSVIHN